MDAPDRQDHPAPDPISRPKAQPRDPTPGGRRASENRQRAPRTFDGGDYARSLQPRDARYAGERRGAS